MPYLTADLDAQPASVPPSSQQRAAVTRVLIALGGNAMSSPDGNADQVDQIDAITSAMERIAELVAQGVDVVLTHGNGPQVGNLLVKNELAAGVVPSVTLDWCVAQTQGTIGLVILNALERALRVRGVFRGIAAVVTRTRVDPDDPGFVRPTKPIGRYVAEHEARAFIDQGQIWANRGARGWRRLVASPEPLEVLDGPAVTALSDAGFVVVATGGGGVPVVRDDDGTLRGVEAVIDKDLAAALLGRSLGVDFLVIATDVENAVLGFGTPDARPIRQITVSELRKYADAGHFASGSMGPKVEAACRFVEGGGHGAVITSMDLIADAVRGEGGTRVAADPKA